MQIQAHEAIQAYCMKPPSKRSNFVALCQPWPFIPKLSNSEYEFYLVESINRGVPVSGSLIYFSRIEDTA
jgi:hypothetical protein